MATLNDQTTTHDIRHDYEKLARLANLRYVSDDELGFTRRRWGRGFTYKDATGKTVKAQSLATAF
ncbi:hypothetical protein [Psychrobacter sp. WY6]|uniref:hypothetical protein n=1 Tax=Psychrobacter sp. WY6 TaxID=2708350 RepID=UPI00202317E3|nr:hypothetical protein [Psychrobacter sp. WY6]